MSQGPNKKPNRIASDGSGRSRITHKEELSREHADNRGNSKDETKGSGVGYSLSRFRQMLKNVDAKYSHLPHLNTALEYPANDVELAKSNSGLFNRSRTSSLASSISKIERSIPSAHPRMEEKRLERGFEPQRKAIHPQSILSSRASGATAKQALPRHLSSISFRVPDSRPRGSISAHPGKSNCGRASIDLFCSGSRLF